MDNVFTASQCSDIIERAERFAHENGGEWVKSGRHQHYDTQDVPLNDLFSFGNGDDNDNGNGNGNGNDAEHKQEQEQEREREQETINGILTKLREFLSRAAKFYSISSERPTSLVLSITDLFVTKYDQKMRSLESHKDKSDFSFVLALNDDFEGGGTFFALKNATFKSPIGSAVVFNGQQYHGGVAVTGATSRYILAGFLDIVEIDVDTGETSKAWAYDHLYSPTHDGFAYAGGFRSNDWIIGIEVCEVDDAGTVVPMLGGEVGVGGGGGVIKKYIRDVTLDTSDEEWQRMAASCEELAPFDDRQFVVKRRRVR
jgi:hypothetical protein